MFGHLVSMQKRFEITAHVLSGLIKEEKDIEINIYELINSWIQDQLDYSGNDSFKAKIAELIEEKKAPGEIDILSLIAKWAEDKWGYIRNNPGVEVRKELIKKMKDNFYIVKYGDQPVGMFALTEKTVLPGEKITALKLSYFYIDAPFRSLGMGSTMLDLAKSIAKNQKANGIIFDTLNPHLNKFYQSHGAVRVCEGHVLGCPVDVFRMSL